MDRLNTEKLLDFKQYLEDEWEVFNKEELCELWDTLEYVEEEQNSIYNRRGKFLIDYDFIKHMCNNQDYYSWFWSNFIILMAGSRFDKHAIEYVACSKKFDPIEEGEEIPDYNIIVKNTFGIVSIELQRIED